MIISVWGNSGSGASTLALKLALELSSKNKNVVLVDTDFISPQLKIWFPQKDFPADASLSSILSNNIEAERVLSKVKLINNFLGVLGYGQGLSINAITSRDDTPGELISVLNNCCDYVIIDCQTNITQDVMSFIAVDVSDVKIVNMTADIRGLSWYESNVLMFKDKWASQKAKVFKVFNKLQLHTPVDSIETVMGTADFYLPYCYELQEEMYEGRLGEKAYKGMSKKYSNVLNTITDFVLSHVPDIIVEKKEGSN